MSFPHINIESFANIIVILILSASILAALTIYAWQFRTSITALSFAILMFAGFLWVFFSIPEVIGTQLESKLFWANVQFIGITSAPVAWLMLALSYTGQQRYIKRLIPPLFVIPIVTNILIWSNDFHHLWRGQSTLDTTSAPFSIVHYNYGLWFYWVHIPFSQLIILASLIILIRAAISETTLYRKQILVMLFGLILPLLVDTLYIAGISPILNFNLTPISFSLAGIIIGLNLSRYQFLDVTPIARDKMIESMGDGIIVVDTQTRIVDMNPVAQRLVRHSLAEAAGQPLGQLFVDGPELAKYFGTTLEVNTQITLNIGSELRDYDLRISPLYGRQKKLIGRLIVLHDINERKKIEAELQAYAAQNIRLFEEEQRQREIVESLRQAMLATSRSMDYNAVLAEILAQLREIIHFDSVGIFLLDDNYLNMVHGIGLNPTGNHPLLALDSDHYIARVFKNQETEIIFGSKNNPDREMFFQDEPLGCLMVTPLRFGQQSLGVLVLHRADETSFTAEDTLLLQAFATQSAIAIKNADLYRQAQNAASLEERNRLAQNLHDAVNQTLFTASIMAETVPKVWEKDPERGRQGLEEVRLLTRGALAEMRALLVELRPQALIERPLGQLLRHLTHAISSRARIPLELTVENDGLLPPDTQIAFYRIAQESFNNIIKHAEATEVNIYLNCEPHQAILSIQDNGLGFDPAKVPSGHMGVKIMRERAKSIGALLTLTVRPGAGTRVEMVWNRKG